MKNKIASQLNPERDREKRLRYIEYERHNKNEEIYRNLLVAFSTLFNDGLNKKFN